MVTWLLSASRQSRPTGHHAGNARPAAVVEPTANPAVTAPDRPEQPDQSAGTAAGPHQHAVHQPAATTAAGPADAAAREHQQPDPARCRRRPLLLPAAARGNPPRPGRGGGPAAV